MAAALIIASCQIGIILGPLITICCIVVKCRQHCCFKVMMLVTLGIEVCLTIPACILCNLGYRSYLDREETFSELNEQVKGCSDLYTEIPEVVIEKQLEDPINYG